jgi:hypothetical protein
LMVPYLGLSPSVARAQSARRLVGASR